MKDNSIFDVRITLLDIFIFCISIPLVFTFFFLSYQLVNQAFVNEQVRENIEAYIAVLGILSGPSYMVIDKMFSRWNSEHDERIDALRRAHKTEDDLNRRKLK
jgi:hypothetical protein